jgi:hypothetical protein
MGGSQRVRQGRASSGDDSVGRVSLRAPGPFAARPLPPILPSHARRPGYELAGLAMHGLKRELAVPGVGAVGRARAVLRRNSLELAHTVTHV